MPDEIKSHFALMFGLKQVEAHKVNRQNGWWNERVDIQDACRLRHVSYRHHLAIELIGLIHTELSEAVEAARKHSEESWRDHKTKDTMVRELAGAVVRIMDMAEFFDLPLAQAIEAEIEANRSRGHMHGGKKA